MKLICKILLDWCGFLDGLGDLNEVENKKDERIKKHGYGRIGRAYSFVVSTLCKCILLFSNLTSSLQGLHCVLKLFVSWLYSFDSQRQLCYMSLVLVEVASLLISLLFGFGLVTYLDASILLGSCSHRFSNTSLGGRVIGRHFTNRIGG